jgi:hypothetical protein
VHVPEVARARGQHDAVRRQLVPAPRQPAVRHLACTDRSSSSLLVFRINSRLSGHISRRNIRLFFIAKIQLGKHERRFDRKCSKVNKNVLSPCFRRHVKPSEPAAFAVISTHHPVLGPRGVSWPFLLSCNPQGRPVGRHNEVDDDDVPEFPQVEKEMFPQANSKSEDVKWRNTHRTRAGSACRGAARRPRSRAAPPAHRPRGTSPRTPLHAIILISEGDNRYRQYNYSKYY